MSLLVTKNSVQENRIPQIIPCSNCGNMLYLKSGSTTQYYAHLPNESCNIISSDIININKTNNNNEKAKKLLSQYLILGHTLICESNCYACMKTYTDSICFHRNNQIKIVNEFNYISPESDSDFVKFDIMCINSENMPFFGISICDSGSVDTISRFGVNWIEINSTDVLNSLDTELIKVTNNRKDFICAKCNNMVTALCHYFY